MQSRSEKIELFVVKFQVKWTAVCYIERFLLFAFYFDDENVLETFWRIINLVFSKAEFNCFRITL